MAINSLVEAIGKLDKSDWDAVFEAGIPRLIHCEFEDDDSASNRVACEMIISNLLFDIRDFVESK